MVIQRLWVGVIQPKAVIYCHFKNEFAVSFKYIFLRKLAMFEKKASYILRKIAMLFHKIYRKAPFINSFFKQSFRFPSAILRIFDFTTSVFLAGLGQLSEVCVMLKLFLEIFIL